MLCLAHWAPCQKMNQQLLWQKLFPEWGNRDKKKTGQEEVSAVGIASPSLPWDKSLPFAGEGNMATGGTSPLTPSMGLGAPFRDWGQLGAAACGRAWEGSGGTRCPSTLVGSWCFRDSKSDPHCHRSSQRLCLRQVGGRAVLQAHWSRNTCLFWDCTMVWFALRLSVEKGWIILRVLLDLDPYLVTLSGNLAHFIHAVSCKVLEEKVFYGLRCSQIILILFLYLMANFS